MVNKKKKKLVTTLVSLPRIQLSHRCDIILSPENSEEGGGIRNWRSDREREWKKNSPRKSSRSSGSNGLHRVGATTGTPATPWNTMETTAGRSHAALGSIYSPLSK